MTATDIINQWLELTNYNPEKTQFNLLVNDYQLHRINEKIITFQNKFDNESIITVLAVKSYFNKFLNDTTISLYDLLVNNKNLDDLKCIYNLFNSNEFDNIEKAFINSFGSLSSSLCKINLLGEIDRDKIHSICRYVLENIIKLKVEVFKKGGEILPFTNLASKIMVFNSIKECLLTIEKAEDCVYLCYISSNNSVDGFFGYFIKNNGNIFSINERLEEDYIGQHQCMRNNRYIENKIYDLFPYEIIDFLNPDYKGYATKQVIDQDLLSFNKINIDTLNIIVVTLYILYNKYVGSILTENIMYVNSLLDINIQPLIDNNVSSNNLIELTNNSNLILAHKELKIDFNENDFLNGKLSQQFDSYKVGFFKNINQEMINIYSKDFNFKNAIQNVLQTDYTQFLLTNKSDTNEISFKNEFIGSKQQLEMQAYYELRKKLSEHIRQKQIEEFNNFGGLEYLKQWYKNLLIKNYNKIKQYCIDSYLNEDKRYIIYDKENNLRYRYITYSNKENKESYHYKMYHNNLNLMFDTSGFYDNKCLDIDNQVECYHYFGFEFINFNHLIDFFNEEFPNFCIGYCIDRRYSGNPILDMVDPVDQLECLLNIRNSGYRFSFNFNVGFSKSNFNKMIKNNK
jgi:hypothetical protein